MQSTGLANVNSVMSILRGLSIAAFALLVSSGAAWAQFAGPGVGAGQQTTVQPNAYSTAPMSNRTLSYAGCVDMRGIPVVAIADRQVSDVARAYTEPNSGRPMIAYNPEVLSWLQPQTRLFFFVHECAHHVAGHALGLGSSATMEQEADCWALNRLHRTGLLGSPEITAIQNDIARFGRGDHTHLPGIYRAANLLGCLNGGGAQFSLSGTSPHYAGGVFGGFR
ncbi:MAG: hypothetical protein O7A03_11315 [Alphaproteobacteria bacterium]|nr:hypothetical protein [Alphaproteobacteria bacterium]